MAIKIRQCMGEPAYLESEMIPANPFETSDMIIGPQLWFYTEDGRTYRITIEVDSSRIFWKYLLEIFCGKQRGGANSIKTFKP